MIGIGYALFRSISLEPPPPSLGAETITKSGIKVRSRAEARIADYFDEKGIKFEYEPVVTNNGRKALAYPDFYLPKYDVFVESRGLV